MTGEAVIAGATYVAWLHTLPQYQSHKRVRAVKIGVVLLYDGDDMIRIKPADEGIKPFVISDESYQKHQPHGGGYWVIYEDGYQSFSPAEAFESGYTKMDGRFPFASGVEVSVKPEYLQTSERRAGALEEICAALQKRTGVENWHPDVIALMNAYHRAEQMTDPRYHGQNINGG